MEKYKYKGKNEEQLKQVATEEIGLTEDCLLFKGYEEVSGILKTKKYILEVVKLSDLAELGERMIEDIVSGIGINGKVSSKIRDKQITFQISSDNNSLLIGKRGHILDSIQNYVRQALSKKIDMFVNIIVDVENYKEKQVMYLERKVKNLAKEVSTTKMDIKLDPMNSYERRIVHNALVSFNKVTSESEGEEPNRYIVIKYKERV